MKSDEMPLLPKLPSHRESARQRRREREQVRPRRLRGQDNPRVSRPLLAVAVVHHQSGNARP
jgi:hypothetical protein